MDNFFAGFILSEDIPKENDEPNNFINYLCSTNILYKNNNIISSTNNSSAKQNFSEIW